MLSLARLSLKGPYQASSIVGILAVLSVVLPQLLGYHVLSVGLSVAALLMATVLVGLVILTQGSASGLGPIGVSLLGVTLVTWLVLDSPMQGVLIGLVHWLPIVILAQTLRSSNSLGLALLSGVAIGLVGVFLQYLVLPGFEDRFAAQMVASAGGADQLSEEQLGQIRFSVQVMALMMVSSLYLLYVLVVFVARSLQAQLFDAGSFGKEFRALALGKRAALVAAALVPIGFFSGQPWLISIAFLLMIAFMFQGIAIVHAKLVNWKQSTLLLVLFYLTLFFAAQISVVLTSITGVIDNWLDFRKLKTETRNHEN